MKKHAAVFVATVIIIYTLVIDLRFIWTMHRIMADQANSRITIPDASSVHKLESEQFPGTVLDFAADNCVYIGGKRMSDEDLKKFLLANPEIKIKIRCDRAAEYSKFRALAFKLSAWGVKDITFEEKAVPDESPPDYSRDGGDSGR